MGGWVGDFPQFSSALLCAPVTAMRRTVVLQLMSLTHHLVCLHTTHIPNKQQKQAYDFLELSRRHGAVLQLGGSDQWGNIINGVELGRKVDGKLLFGLTAPLITTSDGKKMGKTAAGAVWLKRELLSEYEYWQFWRNTNDADVTRFLKVRSGPMALRGVFLLLPGTRQSEDMGPNNKTN